VARGRFLKIAMKKFITLATAGLLLFSLQGARAQREEAPPAVPPMLEGHRPLAQPEAREPAAPKPAESKAKAKTKTKAKGKTKADKKAPKKAAVAKPNSKKAPKVAQKKGRKNLKKKTPETGTKPRGGPDEG
jgi:hypothetical protein